MTFENIAWQKGKGIASVVGVGAEMDVCESLAVSDYIPVSGDPILLLKMPVTASVTPDDFGMCFYDADKKPLKNTGVTVFNGRKDEEPFSKECMIFAPRKAAFFRTTYWTEDFVKANCPEDTFSFTTSCEFGNDRIVTRELPTDLGMLNAIRRTRQLTDIEWEPLVTIPRYSLAQGDYSGHTNIHYADRFTAGHRYKGVPYSGAGEDNAWYGKINLRSLAGQWGYHQMYLGLEIDPETFVTAVRYPNSIMGERKDRDYYDYNSSPYGIVCTGLVYNSFDRKPPTWMLDRFVGYEDDGTLGGGNFFTKIEDQISIDNVEDVRLCDVLWNHAHIGIITDIFRDCDGKITAIEFSESTTVGSGSNAITDGSNLLGGHCVRKARTVEDFYSWFRYYGRYRWKSFNTGITYKPSPFVNTGDEPNWQPVVDLPCIPYLGNRARYKKGFIKNTKILIGAKGYKNLIVTKDGEDFGLFNINGQTEIEIGFSEVGEYRAFLVDGDDRRSCSCYWSVVEFDYELL